MKKIRTNITIDASLKAWLDYYSRKWGVSQNDVITQGLERLKRSDELPQPTGNGGDK